MGNSAAGARISDAGGDSGAATRCQRLVEVKVVNRLGLQFSLRTNGFVDGGLLVELPSTIGGSGKLCVAGAAPNGHAVYVCQVAHSQAVPQEVIFHARQNQKDAPPKVVVHGVDKRGAATEQFLAVVLKHRVSLFGSFSLYFGAAYGTFEGVEDAVRQADAVVVTGTGERGLCSWSSRPVAGQSDSILVCLEVRKTDAGLLAQRSLLLDTLERKSNSLAAQPPRAPVFKPPDRLLQSSTLAVESGGFQRPVGNLPEQQQDARRAELYGTQETPELQEVQHFQEPHEPAHPVTALQETPELMQVQSWQEPQEPLAEPRPSTAVRLPSGNNGDTCIILADNCVIKTSTSMIMAEDCSAVQVRTGNIISSSSSSSSSTARAGVPDNRAAKFCATKLDTHVSTANAASQRSARSTATGALAVRAKAAADEAAERRRLEALRLQEEEMAAVRAREEEAVLRQTQDQEFQQSLLMDQLKDLVARQKELGAEALRLEAEVQESDVVRSHAAQRLERFGDNPRLAEEGQRAAERWAEAKAKLDGVQLDLTATDEQIAEKNALLAAMLA